MSSLYLKSGHSIYGRSPVQRSPTCIVSYVSKVGSSGVRRGAGRNEPEKSLVTDSKKAFGFGF